MVTAVGQPQALLAQPQLEADTEERLVASLHDPVNDTETTPKQLQLSNCIIKVHHREANSYRVPTGGAGGRAAGLGGGVPVMAAAIASIGNTSCRRHTSSTFSKAFSPLSSPLGSESSINGAIIPSLRKMHAQSASFPLRFAYCKQFVQA